MKAIVIKDAFGLDNLQLVDRDEPEPGPTGVKVRLRAASLNFRDLMMVQGLYNPKQPLPLIPCSDGVGEVVAVGDEVRRFKVGDRVATLFFQDWAAGGLRRERLESTLGGPLDGALAELAVFPERGLIHVPEHLSDAEAATLPCAALTAWSALVTQGRVRAGHTVLALGTGGVSIFTLQLAKALGARVIITSSSDAKLERARELGADETVNYADVPKWGKRVQELTGGVGVDHVVEVGGAGTLKQSLEAIRPGGIISMIGVLSGTRSELDVIPLLMKNVRIQGIIVGHAEGFEAMNRAIDVHRIKPVVDREFPLAETRAALEHMAAGKHFGKIVITL